MVITRGDVSDQWTKRIERRLTTLLQLFLHIDLDHLHRHMPWTLDDGLHIVLPRNLGQLA